MNRPIPVIIQSFFTFTGSNSSSPDRITFEIVHDQTCKGRNFSGNFKEGTKLCFITRNTNCSKIQHRYCDGKELKTCKDIFLAPNPSYSNSTLYGCTYVDKGQLACLNFYQRFQNLIKPLGNIIRRFPTLWFLLRKERKLDSGFSWSCHCTCGIAWNIDHLPTNMESQDQENRFGCRSTTKHV